MTRWWTGNCVPYDLETDGKEPDDARIIQWCAGMIGGEVNPDGSPYSWSGLVKPERPIPDEAAGVHGISTERAEADGEAREVAVGLIAARLAAVAGPGVPVVGHNLAYDFTVLDCEMRRLGIGSLGTERDEFGRYGWVTVRVDGRQIGAFPAIDTMVIDKAVDPYRPGPRGPDGEKLGGGRKLTYVTELYGVPIRGDAHDASADAFVAARLAWALARRASMPPVELHRIYRGRRSPHEIVQSFGRLALYDLPNLHVWQIEQAAAQAIGLREYFAKSGEGDPSTVSGEWPLRTIGESEAPA